MAEAVENLRSKANSLTAPSPPWKEVPMGNITSLIPDVLLVAGLFYVLLQITLVVLQIRREKNK